MARINVTHRGNVINISVRKVTYALHEGGRRGVKGDKGDSATNLVQSVNGKQGVVVLDSTDVGADPAGSAAQALQDANDYTDQELAGIDTGVLSVQAGTNVTVDNTDPKNPVVSSTGGVSSVDWGDISGTLSNQTDLQNALDDKQDILAEGAFVNGDKTKLNGIEAGAEVNTVDSVAGKTGAVTLGSADLTATGGTSTSFLRKDNTWATPTNTTYSEITTAEIDAGTASTARTISGRRSQYIVDKARNGVTLDTDTSLAGNAYFLDEDDMASNSDTKVPSQQSVKAYVDTQIDTISPTPVLQLDEFTVPITHSDLVATGMAHWPDGSLGFVDGGGGSRVSIGSNSLNIATVVHDPVTGGVAAVMSDDGTVQNVIDPELDYYSGGPVFAPNAYGLTEDLGAILMLHGEKHDLPNFWSGIGMARTSMIDPLWYDVGLVVTPEFPFTGTLSTSLDVGSGNFAFDDDFYYVFFKDSADGVTVTNLSVARAPLADVVAAATNSGAPAPVFTKYSGGSWSSPGLGGTKADDLLPGFGGYLIWQDVIKVEGYDGWALVYSRDLQTSSSPIDTVEVRWSKDLIHWSEPQTLVAPDTEYERFYITVTPPLDNDPYTPKIIKSNDPLDVYVVKSDVSGTAAERWDTAEVERYRFDVVSAADILSNSVQKTDTDTTDMQFVIDEDNMSSNLATKVPTQQSVKSYVDNKPGVPKTFNLGTHPFFSSVSNTTTETDLNIFTLPANTIENNYLVSFNLTGAVTNTSGSTVTYTYRVKFGSLVWSVFSFDIPTGSTNVPFKANIEAICIDFSGLRLAGGGTINVSSGAAGTNDTIIRTEPTAVDPIPLTTNVPITLTAQMSLANANASINAYSSTISVVNPAPPA